jgi:hypothetical protein
VSNRRRLPRRPPPMPPHVRALADQAEAADSQIRRRLAGVMSRHPGGVWKTSGGVTYTVLMRLQDRILTRALRRCPHLDWRSPSPTFWHAWDPGWLRCEPCQQAAARSIRGTPEDMRCDGCGAMCPDGLQSSFVTIPAAVAELDGGRATHRPSIGAGYGLCDRCVAADAEPFTPLPEPAGSGVANLWTLQPPPPWGEPVP